MPARRDIAIQGGFLFQSLKENRELAVALLTVLSTWLTSKRIEPGSAAQFGTR